MSDDGPLEERRARTSTRLADCKIRLHAVRAALVDIDEQLNITQDAERRGDLLEQRYELQTALREYRVIRNEVIHNVSLKRTEAVINRAVESVKRRRKRGGESVDKQPGGDEKPREPALNLGLPSAEAVGDFLKLFMRREAYRRWVYPQLTELQAEINEELEKGNLTRARIIWLRGLIYLVPGWVYGLAAKTLEKWWFMSS